MGRPLVSVIVPTHNRKRFLRQTILSLLADDGVSTEILVVDDASEDGSLESIADLPVTSLRLDENVGVARARNLGLRACRGELVTFFDSDDLLVPGAITARARVLLALPERVGVGGTIAGEIDEWGAPLAHACPLPPRAPLTLDFYLKGGIFCLGPWLYLFRRRALLRAGGFDESLRIACDNDLMFRLLAKGEIPVLPIPVLLYRRHSENISATNPHSPAFRPHTIAESFLVNASHGIWPGGLRP
jgi:alpha-1,6-rhamnosyltransferase